MVRCRCQLALQVSINVAIVNPCLLASIESVCCLLCIGDVAEKMQEGGCKVSCIINHEGFHSVCLDVWVLQPTSTIDSAMMQSKRRVFMNKWLMHDVFSCVFHLIFNDSLQAILIYGIPPAYSLVLGLAW